MEKEFDSSRFWTQGLNSTTAPHCIYVIKGMSQTSNFPTSTIFDKFWSGSQSETEAALLVASLTWAFKIPPFVDAKSGRFLCIWQ